ncbi:hypothetical protein Hanom_Chr12g01133041 [Helianthus anomalus]
MDSPALSDTLVACSQVVRCFGLGLAVWSSWSGHGSNWMGTCDGMTDIIHWF